MLQKLFSRGARTDGDSEPTSKLPKKKRRGMLAVFVSVMHILGFLTSVHAVMSTRTSQGAIAWAVSANTLPYVAVPAYWVLGLSKFDDYDLILRSEQIANSEAAKRARLKLEAAGLLVEPKTPQQSAQLQLLNNLSKLPLTVGNDADLLIDGKQTFDAILDAISKAENYVLVQFYIMRDDGLGQDLKNALLERLSKGVRVFVLYDELGSKDLSEQYIEELRAANAEIYPFNTTQGNRFRVNFRNHRKIVVVDGDVAFVGGHNVGDEYLGKDPVLTPWRDTHVALRGPVVQAIQVPFVEDWNWATGEKKLFAELKWDAQRSPDGNIAAACVPTGPADDIETGTLWFLQQINGAQKRLWIVSPYFIPDEQLMSALQLAALRGVDVRIIIPQNPDHLHVYLSGISYLEEADAAGIKIYRYQPGFLHQKVFLIDDAVSCIGTANLDNRSMRLNFEVTMLLVDEAFAKQVENMLLEDLKNCELASPDEYTKASLPYRFLVRACRLLAPVQ